MSREDIDNRFDYHAPTSEKIVQHEHVREELRTIARAWDVALPDSREKSLALTKLEEAMFWANSSIARN